MTRRIEDLYGPAQELATKQIKFIQDFLSENVPHLKLVVGDTFRGLTEQQKAFESGHSKAKGKNSPHTLQHQDGTPASCGWDLYLIKEASILPDKDPLWGLIPLSAGVVGNGKLYSGAHFSTIRDWPHTELLNWRELVRAGILK